MFKTLGFGAFDIRVCFEFRNSNFEIILKCHEQIIQNRFNQTKASTLKGNNIMSIGLLIFVFILAIFLGVELITKVPSQLHTPLMSGTNAISGITIVGALTAAGTGADTMASIIGTIALILATINVVGGYLVTNRMLAMFKRKDKGQK